MTPKTAQSLRTQMVQDGFCIIPDILSLDFIKELRRETDRLNADMEHHPDTKYQGTHLGIKFEDNTIMQQLGDWLPARQALEELGFGDFNHNGSLLVLTKEPQAPALYWHQDWMHWNAPLSCTPWPQTIFLSYYLEETRVENGCLKIIPGSHLKRVPLHDQLVTAHEQGARFIEEDHPIMFSDNHNQVNVYSNPGDLVLADARVLHAAHKNQTNESRNLLLIWHQRPETVPDYWEDDVPVAIRNRDPDATYEGTRVPGDFLVSTT